MANAEWKRRWFAEYNKYLDSPAWKAKRLLVFQRDNYTCQACMEGCNGKAQETHHTSYRIYEDTPLFELVSVCSPCHKKITKATRSTKAKKQDLADLWNERQKQRDQKPPSSKEDLP
jgi:5-methylcytosine-specific restriction endonuclease McrA